MMICCGGAVGVPDVVTTVERTSSWAMGVLLDSMLAAGLPVSFCRHSKAARRGDKPQEYRWTIDQGVKIESFVAGYSTVCTFTQPLPDLHFSRPPLCFQRLPQSGLCR